MRTAIISFDPSIAEEFKHQLGEENVRVYIDSISMLKEIDNFEPMFIVYDASAGDFAFDDLKFLLSRDKVKHIKFKILYSKEQPIEDSEILSQSVDIYEKKSELHKVILDILEESKDAQPKDKPEKTNETPTLQEYETNLKEDSIEPIQEDVVEEDENQFKEFSQIVNDKIERNKKEGIDKLTYEDSTVQKKSILESLKTDILGSINDDNITLQISKKDIESMIIKIAVEKLVLKLEEDIQMHKLFESIKVDFINQIGMELENLKEEIRQEIKSTVFKKIEEELMNKVNTEFKNYIAEQITKMIKEKINQAFKM